MSELIIAGVCAYFGYLLFSSAQSVQYPNEDLPDKALCPPSTAFSNSAVVVSATKAEQPKPQIAAGIGKVVTGSVPLDTLYNVVLENGLSTQLNFKPKLGVPLMNN